MNHFSNEAFFQRMLTLERKRSERTGDRFLLMLLHVGKLCHNLDIPGIQKISEAISKATRDTDITGWYKLYSTIGVIFTTLNGAERQIVASAIHEKVRGALCSRLNAAQVDRIEITFHFFPEQSDGDKSPGSTDKTLYPDIAKRSVPALFRSALKRSIDILGSLLALVLLSPLLLLISILIKATSEGPVLFRQQRLGKFGKEFAFLKFRSMYVLTDPGIHLRFIQNMIRGHETHPDGTYKIKNDPRVTPLGRVLRKTSLDELPQFWNVLAGDMSLVGPRPPIPYEYECYDSWHRRRVIEVKPGITGLWQVHGRSRTTFDEMVRLDLRYIQNQSLWLDFKILLKTPIAVLRGEGAY